MSDESFVLPRSNNAPKKRVRAMFVCPSCGWRLQAVLEQELTTVRCECEAEFAVRKPVSKPKACYQGGTISRPPLRSILQSSGGGGSSDTSSHASLPSRSSVQSVMVSHCSSASSAVMSINAPSVHSIDSPTAERRSCTVERATRVGLPQALLEGERGDKGGSSAEGASRRDAAPSTAGTSSAAGRSSEAAVLSFLGQIFATSASLS